MNREIALTLSSIEDDPFGGGSFDHRIAFMGPMVKVDPPEVADQAEAYYQYIQDQASVDPVGARASFADLAAMAEAHPELIDIQRWLAKAASVHIYDLVKAGDLAAALSVHDQLHCLASQYPEERDLRCEHVAIQLLLPTNQMDLVVAQSIYARVAAVSEAYPEDL